MKMAALLATGLALTGCDVVSSIGAGIDEICVIGKLDAADAAYLNGQHDKWATLPAKAGDRVVNGDCSAVLKSVTEFTN